MTHLVQVKHYNSDRPSTQGTEYKDSEAATTGQC